MKLSKKQKRITICLMVLFLITPLLAIIYVFFSILDGDRIRIEGGELFLCTCAVIGIYLFKLLLSAKTEHDDALNIFDEQERYNKNKVIKQDKDDDLPF